MADDNKGKGGNNDWLSDSIVIALSPVLAYILSYAYELGYTGHFGIPKELISVGIMNTLIMAGVLTVIAVPTFLLINILIILFHGVDNPIVLILKDLLPFYLTAFAIVLAYGGLNDILVPFITAILLFTAFVFLFPLATHQEKKPYIEKLKAQRESERALVNISSYIWHYFGNKGIVLFFILYIGCLLSYNSGIATAIKKEEFMLIPNNPNIVVLNKYGSSLVCAKFDEKSGTIYREYSIINMDNNQELTFVTKKVGRLTLEPNN